MDEEMLRFYRNAVQIQDACNIVAVTNELKDAMISRRKNEMNERTDPAVLAIFFKVYDMLGGPDVKTMYDALKKCEEIIKTG